MNATRIDRWTCPLCGQRLAATDTNSAAAVHGLAEHPATYPDRMTTGQRLAWLPRLVAEIKATIGAPNPTERAVRSVHSSASSAPTDLAALDALAPDDGREIESWTPVARLVECSRLVWEVVDLDARHTRGAVVEPTITSEARWLASVWGSAQASLDLSVIEWIDGEIRDVFGQLAAVARVRPPQRFRCPTCGSGMSEGEGGWMVCDSGMHAHPGAERLEREWRRKGPMTARAISGKLGVSLWSINTWRKRGKLNPMDPNAKPATFLPWDVIALWRPDIVEAINERDTLAS